MNRKSEGTERKFLRESELELGFEEIHDRLIKAPPVHVLQEKSFQVHLGGIKNKKCVVHNNTSCGEVDELNIICPKVAQLYLVRYMPQMSPEELVATLEADGYTIADPFSAVALHTICDLQEVVSTASQWQDQCGKCVNLIFPRSTAEVKSMYLYKSSDHWPGHGWWFTCTKNI